MSSGGRTFNASEMFDIFLAPRESGKFRISSSECTLDIGVRSGYIVEASLNGETIDDPVDIVGLMSSILTREEAFIEFINEEVKVSEAILPLDLLVLYVATILDEMVYFGDELPSDDLFIRVRGIPENISDLPGKFIKYIAKRFGVGMWVPIKRVPLSSCFNGDFVRYMVLVTLKEYPDFLEVRQQPERRYDMQSKLHELLKKLVEESPDTIGVVVATPDGLPIAYYSSYNYDPEIQAAISSAIVALSESSVRDADLGNTSEILIVADKGKIFLYPLGDLVMGILTDKDANTGLIFMKVRKALDDIREAAAKETEMI